MKIALFGGTFDPPHNGHELVTDTLIDKNIVDEVWFVPVFEHPWADRYQKKMSPYSDRVAMLKRLFEGKDNRQIAHYKDVSFTYNTLEFFSKKYPEHTFTWVMGSEYLSKFEDFLVDHPKLMEYLFLVYPRAGYELKPIYSNMLIIEEVKTIRVSSTEVRDKFLAKENIAELVNSKVADYISKCNLYRN